MERFGGLFALRGVYIVCDWIKATRDGFLAFLPVRDFFQSSSNHSILAKIRGFGAKRGYPQVSSVALVTE